ncbi:TraR/DksA family transcriptional regulator [Halovulum dunhuangense]|uniref:TraR/DksA family transcriptional regulator n=1 Tax=Halovulum dunhuangense TaxID=1505036 RepID=A0A849L301_9RHOB|nr:TraR/DksA family transcriptional regulator [Halovulum dunhuangense]NNU80679.1 TraR/DksA family transcriptional regulator [Halovulum dunhuangense]
MGKWDKRRAALETRLGELNERLLEIEEALDAPAPQDDEDRATEREDDEVMERLGNSGRKEIEMIRAALGRIEDGSYGQCVTCGDDISEERLDLLPATPFCRRCAG